jgi:hypothetical protein
VTAHDHILSIVRQSLDRGQSVEIDGLGAFRKAGSGGYEFVPESQPRVFLAYAVEDLACVRRLRDSLAAAGCSPWLDKDKLLPGQNWPRAIERAIDFADAFVACFSSRSTAKYGQFQSELRYALDCARRKPLDEVFLIPVRLEPCEVPSRISRELQYVDLFPDWDKGVRRVVQSVCRAAARKSPPARLQSEA